MAIYRHGKAEYWKTVGAIALMGGFAIFSGNRALAQSNIVPDATLGDESSFVVPNFNGLPVEAIEGGAVRGQNLFHSFEEFNVSEGRSAYFFSPDAAIQNILARVTGTNRSEIFGVLGTVGNSQPNLFLVNPNGIVFGQNASLNVGGSFVASTANSLLFDNGFEFSAKNPQTPPLLTINTPLGLQFGENPGRLVNQSILGLEVQPGRTLALVGGEITLEGGRLFAPDGRIELGSVAGNNWVSLKPALTGYTLGYDGVENFQDIQLTQQASVAIGGNSGGSVQVQGRKVTLTDGSQITVNLLGEGIGGNLFVNASDSVQVIGTFADGQFATNLSVQADANTTGNAGDLTINTSELLVLNGGLVSASTLGTGKGGNLFVNASDSVQLIGASADGEFVSGLAAQAQGRGNLIINASESVYVIGESADGRFASNLSAQSEGTGDTGSFLRINTSRLLISDGAVVSAGTLGASKGGNLRANVSDNVSDSVATSANGQDGNNPFGGNIFNAISGIGSTAGNLIIVTGQLFILDGAKVTVTSLSGQAGNLGIATNSLFLDRGSITAETAKSGDTGGANIALQVSDVWLMRNESLISATAYGTANGGNINIDTQFLVAIPPEGPKGSDIIANAQQGNGGRINITTQGLFDIEFRPKLTPDNDITASSEVGLDGEVIVNQPDVDPRQGLTNLPTDVVDATRQIDNRCTPAAADKKSSFVITGRGGLPPSPTDPLQGESVIAPDWVTLDSEADNISRVTPPINSTRTVKPLVEAQSWVYGANGEVILTAQAPSVTRHNTWSTSPSCDAVRKGEGVFNAEVR